MQDEGDAARPAMSVVVVVGDLRRRAGPCLRALLDQRPAPGLAPGDGLEILLLDRGSPGCGPVPHADAPRVRVLPQPREATYAGMRAQGVAAARAPVVAFLEEHVRVRPGWAAAQLAAFRDGWDGVGTAVAVANPGCGEADLVGLLSYGLFFPPVDGGESELLPGHNASYRTEVLRSLGDDLEPLLHADLELQRRLRADGRRLCLLPEVTIDHLSEGSLRQLARGVFLFYRCYGPLRARSAGWSRLRRAGYVLATPLVPVYFVTLFGLRLWRRRSPHLRLLLRHVPAVLAVQLCAAAGQALGLLRGEGDAQRRFTDYELHEPRPDGGE